MDEDLISAIKSSYFIMEKKEIITKLCALPNLKRNKDFVLKKLLKEIKKLESSILSDTPNEKN